MSAYIGILENVLALADANIEGRSKYTLCSTAPTKVE